MSKLYVNPLTGERARLMNRGVGVVLYGKIGNHYLSEKIPQGTDPVKFWHRYLHRLGYKTIAEIRGRSDE